MQLWLQTMTLVPHDKKATSLERGKRWVGRGIRCSARAAEQARSGKKQATSQRKGSDPTAQSLGVRRGEGQRGGEMTRHSGFSPAMKVKLTGDEDEVDGLTTGARSVVRGTDGVC